MAGSAGLAAVALIVHILAAIVWVGGMFFAHQVLRPAAAMLEPGPRLILWSRVLGRFFAWVIAAIILLLLSGYALVFGVFGGFRAIGLYINLMQGLGILMMLLFLHLYFAPWRRFRLAGLLLINLEPVSVVLAVSLQHWGQMVRSSTCMNRRW